MSLNCFLDALSKCSNLRYHQPKNGLFLRFDKEKNTRRKTGNRMRPSLPIKPRSNFVRNLIMKSVRSQKTFFGVVGICGELLIDWFIIKLYCIPPQLFCFWRIRWNQVGVRNDCRFSWLCHLWMYHKYYEHNYLLMRFTPYRIINKKSLKY